MDLIDDIYSIAYWMTGSEIAANKVVYSTYLNVNSDTSECGVFKAFRECYFKSIDEDISLPLSESKSKLKKSSRESLRQRFADIKLSVLISEISGLKHGDISKIIGKPLDSIRLWLSSGSQSLAGGLSSLDSTPQVRHFNL